MATKDLEEATQLIQVLTFTILRQGFEVPPSCQDLRLELGVLKRQLAQVQEGEVFRGCIRHDPSHCM